MERNIRKAAILGSGIMGSGLASHLLNAGLSVSMLDIVPRELTEDEKAKGLTLESPAVRNRIVNNNKLTGMDRMKPPGIMSKQFAGRIATGNIEDNLEWLRECDWVIEVVAEKMEIKQTLLQKIAPYLKPGAIVSTNTSGLSINRIAQDMPLEFRKNWLGIHFFNPVRYMKLVELIPGAETDKEVLDFMYNFCEHVLGKFVVMCKDTPCFIANRVGAGLGTDILQRTVEYDLSFSEVDDMVGDIVGRPRTATFRLYDMVGLDIGITSAKTVSNNISDADEKKLFVYPAFVDEMLANGQLGDKVKQGFYKKDDKNRLMFDYKTKEYIPLVAPKFESLDAAAAVKTLPEKLTAMFEGTDVAAKLVWGHMKDYLMHVASILPEIADDIYSVDCAMELGYNHKAGPFRVWNGVDLPKYITRMESEGAKVPVWIKDMLAAGVTSFYKEENGQTYYYSIPKKTYKPVSYPKEMIVLSSLKADGKVAVQYPEAALVDLGDGIVAFEIQSKNAALSAGLTDAFEKAYVELNKNWLGMVITSAGKNFCVGADLKSALAMIQNGAFSDIEASVVLTQQMTLRHKYSPKPIVSAPYSMALGGGCEIAMQCSASQVAGETYMGLVELGVGLIPAGGGTKEITMRALQRTTGTMASATDFLMAAIQTIAMGKVSSSAYEAIELGLLRETDGVSLSHEYQLADAKRKVLNLISEGYKPPVSEVIPCPGINDNGVLLGMAKNMLDGGNISEYDYHLFSKLVYIMTGGGVSKGKPITEQYLLDLEREVFVELCKERRTQERIDYMLSKGKPLRN